MGLESIATEIIETISNGSLSIVCGSSTLPITGVYLGNPDTQVKFISPFINVEFLSQDRTPRIGKTVECITSWGIYVVTKFPKSEDISLGLLDIMDNIVTLFKNNPSLDGSVTACWIFKIGEKRIIQDDNQVMQIQLVLKTLTKENI